MKLKLIQVGLGAHGTGVGSRFVIPSADFDYAGLVDINPKNLEDAAEILDVPKHLLFTDYNQAFQELVADAVLIEAASPAHYEICKAALHHNLHVLIEKPFVLNMAEAEELVEIAAEKNLKIAIDQNYRYYSTVLTLKQAIQNGELGKPLFANAQFYLTHDGKPYQREMEDYMLMEMAVHHIDMIRFLLDCNITGVSGKTWNANESDYKGDPNVSAVYETEIGIPVFYLGSLISKGSQTPWEGVWRIQCEEGSIHLDDLGEGYGIYLIDSTQSKSKMPPHVSELEGIHGVLREFAYSIREDNEPVISGRDNLQTLSTLFATSISSRERKWIAPKNLLKHENEVKE